ncbi:MAG: hypothetical protein ACX936_09435 [Marinobacter sp.]
MGFKAAKAKIADLVISPSLSPEYRRTILGLTYRVSSFPQIPEPMLLDYILAHPPICKKVGKNFHVVANVRTLALKPFLPGDTRVRVIVDDAADRSDIVVASACRELINLIISGMTNQQYQYAVVALWELFLKADQNKPLAVTGKTELAPIVGLRRQALSEIAITKGEANSAFGGGSESER